MTTRIRFDAKVSAVSRAEDVHWEVTLGSGEVIHTRQLTASFDWPAIEAVAAVSGANQAMAKLLLAARSEGTNSRWPF